MIGKSSFFAQKNHRSGMFKNNAARSISTSPSLGASRTPLQKSLASTSVPTDAKSQKDEAMKTALLHLLAIRAVSKNFLAKSVKCTSEEFETLLHKYGRPSRLDSSKYDLSDRGYKELKIWEFPYQSESDRQGAIDRAVSAFDRMRISREEKLWQMLLPKEQRNKGIILSKLQLHNGPVQKVSTPLINVEQMDEGRKETTTGGSDEDRRSRLVPSDADSGARSEPAKKKKISEKEAQSKRLLSKNPKKATQAAKAKESKVASKESKSSAKKETMKETSKSTTPSAAKVKSPESVHHSDEDVEMDDTLTIIDPDVKPKTITDSKQRQSSEKSKEKPKEKPKDTPTTIPKSKTTASSTLTKSTSAPSNKSANKSTVTTSSSSSSDQLSTNGLHRPVPMQRNISHSRNTSSPIKPSPLGSSPPTNASDLDNDSHPRRVPSTNPSPLITSAPKDTGTPTSKGVARKITRPVQGTPEPNQTNERAKKRKAEDSYADSPTPVGGAVTNGVQHPAKRHQTTAPSPSLSDSSGSPSSPMMIEMVKLAKSFKTYYAQYEKLHRELSASPNPSNDQVERLLKMHNRLETMKADITKGTMSV